MASKPATAKRTTRRATARRPVRKSKAGDSLAEYRAKRNFQKTAEPAGRKEARTQDRFVIQKHAASRLHYDFRLEVDGTLKSWAVPKGVPFAKGDKRLAVQVEDHPVEYGGFEGIIPKGQYGGGTVMLWDTGTFENLGGDAAADLAAGKLHFALKGKKLRGEWTLVRIHRGEGHEWLLIKSGADLKPISKKADDESCISGRTMAQIANQKDAAWQSNRAEKKKKLKPAAALTFISPMKATLVEEPPRHGHWLYELKFDGYRALALKSGAHVQLLSRNEKNFAEHYPEIVEGVAALDVHDAILDGEVVALQGNGVPSFQLLQGIETGATRPPLAFYVFDVLRHDGEDLTGQPLHERRARLEKILATAEEPVRFSASLKGEPEKLLAEIKKRGLEGLIGKARDSRYEIGRRSSNWIKLKCVHEQEFVIGGHTPPEGTRKHFGALLVGVHEKGELRFAGKVGTGFNTKLLEAIYRKMRALDQEECPFANLPEKQQGRWVQNITPREMSRCHWVAPRMVCQVRFTEWTSDGKLRHPVFIGLREDKDPSEITREVPA
jgi:bifunctional non-homologous end joining protein LigD